MAKAPCTLDEETRALLTRAATAVGIAIVEWVGDQANVNMDGGHYGWNPLAKWGTGGALTLAVKLRLGLIPLEGGGWQVVRYDFESCAERPLATCANSGAWALQQAIVEAAAALVPGAETGRAAGRPAVFMTMLPADKAAANATYAAATAGVAWDASQIKQPGWHHVEAAFIEGAREARANPEASEGLFRRAADGYTKRVFEEVDPVSEAALRTESWKRNAGVALGDGYRTSADGMTRTLIAPDAAAAMVPSASGTFVVGTDGRLRSACVHARETTNIGPTTDQINHYCADCGASWTTFPPRCVPGATA